jgi:hypothetical protein
MEAFFLEKTTQMLTARRILMQAAAVLSQPLREWLQNFTDPYRSVSERQNPMEVMDIIEAITSEGLAVLQHRNEGCNVSRSILRLVVLP